MASPSAALCMNPHCAGGAFIFSLDAQNPINLGQRLIPLTQVRLYIVAMPAFQNRRAALAAARADEAVRPAPFE